MKIFWFDVETSSLDAVNGDILTLSGFVEIDGIIKDYPDRNSSFVGFYPIAIANIIDLEDMGVIQTGSRVVYRYFLFTK